LLHRIKYLLIFWRNKIHFTASLRSCSNIGFLNELWSRLAEKSPLPPFVKGGSRVSGGGILPFSTTQVGLL
jgi:hypothetical protein